MNLANRARNNSSDYSAKMCSPHRYLRHISFSVCQIGRHSRFFNACVLLFGLLIVPRHSFAHPWDNFSASATSSTEVTATWTGDAGEDCTDRFIKLGSIRKYPDCAAKSVTFSGLAPGSYTFRAHVNYEVEDEGEIVDEEEAHLRDYFNPPPTVTMGPAPPPPPNHPAPDPALACVKSPY